jgi:hypothetical protein
MSSAASSSRWNRLNSINVVGGIVIAAAVRTVHVVELDVVVQIAADEIHGFVDLHRFGEFAVGLEVSRLIS